MCCSMPPFYLASDSLSTDIDDQGQALQGDGAWSCICAQWHSRGRMAIKIEGDEAPQDRGSDPSQD